MKRRWTAASPPAKRGILAGLIGGATLGGLLVLLFCCVMPLRWFFGGGSGKDGIVANGPKENKMAAGPAGTPTTTSAQQPDPRFAGVAKPDFSSVDYSKGPKGEALEVKEWKDGDSKIKAPGFDRGKGSLFFKHGLVKVWFLTGEKESEAYWFNDKRHGSIVVWHRNGQKMREGFYKNGGIEGYSVEWHDNGNKKFEGVYKGGLKNGLCITYYRNGKVLFEVEFADGNAKTRTEKWFSAEGAKATGPTVKALTKTDVVNILSYLLQNRTGDVHGSFAPVRDGYDILANFRSEFYMDFFGPPHAGFDNNFLQRPRQRWSYNCEDCVVRLDVECAGGRVIAREIRFLNTLGSK